MRLPGRSAIYRLIRIGDDQRTDRVSPSHDVGASECEHLAEAPADLACDPPADGDSADPHRCRDCRSIGEENWAHLRKCLSCGHISCCDSSPRRHASEHFAATGHPVMRSAEPWESWRWCFIDAELG